MPLTLRAISLNDHPLTQPLTAHFDAKGGSIGRADHNTLALPDPERHISRQQAEIRPSGSGYSIRNVGSANPIVVQGATLGRGESAPLGHLDRVRVGGYLLEVLDDDAGSSDEGSEARTVVAGRAAVEAAAPMEARRMQPPSSSPDRSGAFGPRTTPGGASGGLGELNAPLSPGNPFADLLGASAAAVPTPPTPSNPGPTPAPIHPFAGLAPAASGVPASSGAWATAPSAPARRLLPDDFDPFAPLAPPPPGLSNTGADASPGHAAGDFADLIPHAAPASIDDLFGLVAAADRDPDRDPLADFMAMPTPRRAGLTDAAGGTPNGLAGLPTDPLAALFGNGVVPTPLQVDAGPSRADDVPERAAAFVPPAVLRPTIFTTPPPVVRSHPDPEPSDATARPPQPALAPARVQSLATPPSPMAGSVPPPPATARWQGTPEELWTALCEGAGISVELPRGLDPEQMRVVGHLLQAAIAGTLKMMAVRATTKHELGADVTRIRARDNNPLKFSPDARSALEQLLKPPMRGFLAGPAAMTDAMHDLVGHTIGTVAGMRAALEGVLDRFMPHQLEAKLAGRSVIDSLLPMNRKARLWELYLQHCGAIRNEAHDDFQALFGRAFLTAYEQQLDRLHEAPPAQLAGRT